MPPRIKLQKLLKSPENRGKIMCFGVKNGGFPPFFIGLMSQGPVFRGVGRLFVLLCVWIGLCRYDKDDRRNVCGAYCANY